MRLIVALVVLLFVCLVVAEDKPSNEKVIGKKNYYDENDYGYNNHHDNDYDKDHHDNDYGYNKDHYDNDYDKDHHNNDYDKDYHDNDYDKDHHDNDYGYNKDHHDNDYGYNNYKENKKGEEKKTRKYSAIIRREYSKLLLAAIVKEAGIEVNDITFTDAQYAASLDLIRNCAFDFAIQGISDTQARRDSGIAFTQAYSSEKLLVSINSATGIKTYADLVASSNKVLTLFHYGQGSTLETAAKVVRDDLNSKGFTITLSPENIVDVSQLVLNTPNSIGIYATAAFPDPAGLNILNDKVLDSTDIAIGVCPSQTDLIRKLNVAIAKLAIVQPKSGKSTLRILSEATGQLY